MNVLVPIDGSETSFDALRFAAEFADRFEGSLHVVHFADEETDATDQLADRARDVLDEEGVLDAVEISIDSGLDFRPSNRVGRNIVAYAEKHGFDHVVMGHHGSGAIGRVILGSAAETVLASSAVPVTVVP